jgi:protein ImuB
MQAFAPGAVRAPRGDCSTEARLSLRRFRPPKYAQVIVAQERPVRINSPAVSGPVVVAKGPWRTSGDWWRVSRWKRDEWDVETAAGGLYRLYQEIDSRRWFVEGSYD